MVNDRDVDKKIKNKVHEKLEKWKKKMEIVVVVQKLMNGGMENKLNC